MDIKPISASLSVGPQILPSDMPAIAERGFRAIICNRPDGEAADQPAFREIRESAENAGLECRYMPVAPGKIGDSDAAAFGAALEMLPKPVLAFCRTGTRSAMLWSLDQGAKGTPLPAILQATGAAGYDVTGLVKRIEG